jgi:hypothetical protein
MKLQTSINSEVKSDFDDINKRNSTKTGFAAVIENTLRKLGNFAFGLVMIPIISVCTLCIAIALTPGVLIFQWMQPLVVNYPMLLKSFCFALSFSSGFISFIIALLFVVPIFNLPIIPFVKPNRGGWFSIESIPWYYHNALTYLVRYTVLDLITPSPLNVLFFKMMGMKVGKGVLLNTSNISDPCLITIDDYVTIGGSAYLMAHYGMKGFLIIDKLHIKTGAMVGLAAKILGGVTIGERAVIAPNVVVLPKSNIMAGEKFGFSITPPAATTAEK